MGTKSNDQSILRREISLRQLSILLAFLYSCAIISTIAPSIGSITPNSALLLYYILVPGYCVSFMFGEHYDALQHIVFSVFISVSLFLSLLAVNHISHSFSIPLALSLPLISIAVIAYGFYSHRW